MVNEKIGIGFEGIGYDKSVEAYDIQEAKKLITNINSLKNLQKLPVSKIKRGEVGETYTLKDWIIEYCKVVDWTGGTGYEGDILKILEVIDIHLQTIASRMEEGMRKVLLIADKRGAVIDYYNSVINKYRDLVSRLENDLVETQLNKYNNKVFSGSKDDNSETEVVVKKPATTKYKAATTRPQ